MAGNKTRVQVKGTIGKSVPLPGSTSLAGYATEAWVANLLQQYTPLATGVASTTIGSSGSGGGSTYSGADSVSVSGTTIKLVNDSASPGDYYFYGTNGSGVRGWYTQGVSSGDSITGSGNAANPLELVNDTASPGDLYYYGTNGSGTKGWYSIQGLSPTLTGNWTFMPASGVGADYYGVAGSYAAGYVGASTSNQSFGLAINAGTSSSDVAFNVTNAAGTARYVRIWGDGGVSIGPSGTTDEGAGTLNVSAGLYIAGAAVKATQFVESAGWNSTSGAVQLSLAVAQDILIPYACTLEEVVILTQGGTGSCTVTLWKTPIGSFPPTSAGDITDGAPPAIASGVTYTNTSLSGWTTSFSQNDVIRATLSANTNFTSVKIILRMA